MDALTYSKRHFSCPMPFAVRQGAHVAPLVDGQPGVLDQLWLPAKRKRRVVMGESLARACISGCSVHLYLIPSPPAGTPLPTACDLQLDKTLHSGRRGVLPRANRLPQAAMRPDAVRRDDCDGALARGGLCKTARRGCCNTRGSKKVGSRICTVSGVLVSAPHAQAARFSCQCPHQPQFDVAYCPQA